MQLVGKMHIHWGKLSFRDFFILTALKAGPGLLRGEGILGNPVEWRADESAFRQWVAGTTGLPFVDACMQELSATGYMSNRGRQNVAGLFCKVRCVGRGIWFIPHISCAIFPTATTVFARRYRHVAALRK